MAIGQMRERITFERELVGNDGMGGYPTLTEVVIGILPLGRIRKLVL